MACTLLTIGMLVTGLPRSAAGSDFNKDGVAAFIIKNEITKIQETLRDKGHYSGKVYGLFGLRTRAGIRAYRKAENLPITGQVDSRTAEDLASVPYQAAAGVTNSSAPRLTVQYDSAGRALVTTDGGGGTVKYCYYPFRPPRRLLSRKCSVHRHLQVTAAIESLPIRHSFKHLHMLFHMPLITSPATFPLATAIADLAAVP
jgi:putative peptidoglycan binding protein